MESFSLQSRFSCCPRSETTEAALNLGRTHSCSCCSLGAYRSMNISVSLKNCFQCQGSTRKSESPIYDVPLLTIKGAGANLVAGLAAEVWHSRYCRFFCHLLWLSFKIHLMSIYIVPYYVKCKFCNFLLVLHVVFMSLTQYPFKILVLQVSFI